MRTIMRWLVVATAALLCSVAVGACGASDESTQSQATAGGSDDEEAGDDGDAAPGIPGGDSGEEAPGAPINIPSFQNDQGRPLDEVLAELESAIRDQCGGELCVELRVVNSNDNFTECTFVATDPPQESQVERGSTVVVIAGTRSCEDEQPDVDEDTTEEPTDQPTEETTEETAEAGQ